MQRKVLPQYFAVRCARVSFVNFKSLRAVFSKLILLIDTKLNLVNINKFLCYWVDPNLRCRSATDVLTKPVAAMTTPSVLLEVNYFCVLIVMNFASQENHLGSRNVPWLQTPSRALLDRINLLAKPVITSRKAKWKVQERIDRKLLQYGVRTFNSPICSLDVFCWWPEIWTTVGTYWQHVHWDTVPPTET